MAPTPDHPTRQLWRVFPYDPSADPGDEFSAQYVPARHQGSGRFDVAESAVIYLAEDPVHAIAEKLHKWRGRTIRESHLRERGRPLALVEVEVTIDAESLVDVCLPPVVASRDAPPDEIAAREASTSQEIAARIFGAEDAPVGIRWWSSFWGEWHSVVLFRARLPDGAVEYGDPSVLAVDQERVRDAAAEIGVAVRRLSA